MSLSTAKQKLEPSKHFVAGTTAGLVSTVLLYPLDLIKVRYQVNEQTTVRQPLRLRAAFNAVVRTEGWRGLYQGLPSAMYGAGLSWGGYFFFYEHAKSRWLGTTQESRKHAWWQHLMAACEAGTIMVGLTNPIWLVKTRMQLQLRSKSLEATSVVHQPTEASPRLYRGFFDALATIVREEGVLSLYKGSIPALLLVSHGAVQFVVYEWLKAEFPKIEHRFLSTQRPAGPQQQQEAFNSASQLTSGHFLVMGAVAKVVASIATYPFQVIKTRLQQRRLNAPSDTVDATSTTGPPEKKIGSSSLKKWKMTEMMHGTRLQYRGVVDCVVKTWKYEGAYGFYKGCLPNAIRVAPGAAVTFFTYETIASVLRN